MARVSLKNIHKLINETAKTDEFPVELFFLQALEKSIVIEDNKNRRIPSKSYKPSSMTCMRRMYYERMGMGASKLVKNESPSSIGILESGTDRHERIQIAISKMKENGFDIIYYDVETYLKEKGITDIDVVDKRGMETKLWHKKYHMSFMCDGILKINGKYYIFEFKTEISEKNLLREDVDVGHEDQATAYSLAFGIDDVLFLYENRNNCDKKSFIYTVTTEGRQEMINKIETVEDNCTKGVLPPKTSLRRKCYWCSYKDICKVDYNEIPADNELCK